MTNKKAKKNDEEQTQPWRQESEARLRRNRQYSVEDIRVFDLDVGVTDEEFEDEMEARVNHIRRVASTFVEGFPVTPPNLEGFATYHAVRLKDKEMEKEREEGDPVSAVLLFEEFSLYFTAFQVEIKGSGPLSARGWLALKDAKMPEFLEHEIINYSVRYSKTALDIILGFGVKKDILHRLIRFNADNRMQKSAEREQAIHTTPYMMSELLRLGKALKEVAYLIKQHERAPLTHLLVNNWGNVSRAGLSFDLTQEQSILRRAAKDYKLDLIPEGSDKYSLNKLVGADGYVRVLLYSGDEVEALLKKRQKDNPPTRFLAVKILINQAQAFHISEVEKHIREECCRHGKVTGFFVDDTQNIFVQFSHPRGAFEAKIYLDGSVIGKHIVDARFSTETSFSLVKESCKGKQVEVQENRIINAELSNIILLPNSGEQIMPSHQILTNEAVEMDTFQGSSSTAGSSNNQIPLSDHFTDVVIENVRPGKQNVEQEPEEPALLDKLHLLASIVRSSPTAPSEGITISLTLLRRLGKFLPPSQLEYYNSNHGMLADLLARHPELFVVEGNLTHLRQGAQQRISAQIADAKVKGSPRAKISTKDLIQIAVTPPAPRREAKASVVDNLLLLRR